MYVTELLREFADQDRKPFPAPTASTRKCRRAIAVHGAPPRPEPAEPARPGRLAALTAFVAWVLSEASKVAYVDVPASRPVRNPARQKDAFERGLRNLLLHATAGETRSERDRRQAEFLRSEPEFARYYRGTSRRAAKIRLRQRWAA